jgi:DNA-binding transcriptional MerR regulator
MSHASAPLWSIDELGAQLSLALVDQQVGAPNGRVREIPDLRTIRYYTTLGLIDRPAQMRGRTALYGRRHLLQLVAIKRLQAKGLGLAEIQERLLGLSDAALGRLAQLPTDAAQPDHEPRREAFWKEPPGPVQALAEAEALPEANLLWQGVSIEEEVMLLLQPVRNLDDEDIQALRVAAAPLLKLLHKRRLLRPRHERGQP